MHDIFFAYLDPGTGSILFQALIAGAILLSLYVKSVFRFLVRIIFFWKTPKPPNTPPPHDK
jgi:hypothetical protein